MRCKEDEDLVGKRREKEGKGKGHVDDQLPCVRATQKKGVFVFVWKREGRKYVEIRGRK